MPLECRICQYFWVELYGWLYRRIGSLLCTVCLLCVLYVCVDMAQFTVYRVLHTQMFYLSPDEAVEHGLIDKVRVVCLFLFLLLEGAGAVKVARRDTFWRYRAI